MAGPSSGSGKIVFEHYDKLVQKKGESASTEPSLFRVHVDSFSEEQESSSSKSAISSAASLLASSVALNSISSNHDSLVEDFSNVYTDSVREEEPIKQSSSAKRKSEENRVPRLINNKQKHLEKTQRNQLLLQEAKDDAQFRKTLTETLRASNRVFVESLHGISKSLTDLENNFCRSMQMLTQAMIMETQPQHPVPQNMFFQSPQSFSTLSSNLHILAVTLLVITIWQILRVITSLILNQKIKKTYFNLQ